MVLLKDRMFLKAKQMLEKARQKKYGNHPTILSRWYAQEKYRKSLAKHDIGAKEVMHFDRIALERHDCTATRAERLQNAHMAETQQSLRPIRPEHQQDQQFGGGENFDYYVDRKTGWR